MKTLRNATAIGLACLLAHPALANTGNVDVYGSIGSSTGTSAFVSDGSSGALYVADHMLLVAPEDHTFRFTRLEIDAGGLLSFANVGPQGSLTLLASEAIVIKGRLDPWPALELTLAAPRVYFGSDLYLPGGSLNLFGADAVEIGSNARIDVAGGNITIARSPEDLAQMPNPREVDLRGSQVVALEYSSHGEISTWSSFNIDSQASVRFQEPATTSNVLNRIGAEGNISVLAGNLNAKPSLEAGVLTAKVFTLPTSDGIAILRSANNISLVPEPETYALMLAGLGLVGLAARRAKLAR